MSLAALPPQSGFVSEWYAFQTLFQGMQVKVIAARLTIALAAAGLGVGRGRRFGNFRQALRDRTAWRRAYSSNTSRVQHDVAVSSFSACACWGWPWACRGGYKRLGQQATPYLESMPRLP